VWRRNIRPHSAHAEVDAPATLHRSRDIRGNRQVGDHDLGAGRAQSRRAFIFAMDQRAHREAALTEQLRDRPADSADASGGARDQDGIFDF